jgi:hypothetical protein
MITDGEGVKFGIDVDALFLFETKKQSLKKVLDKMIQTTAKIKTMGAPPKHFGDPSWINDMTAIMQDVAELLK